MRQLCSIIILACALFAGGNELKYKPSGYAKDLYLLKFMGQDITPNEAYEAYFLTKAPKSEHSSFLLKKTKSKKLSRLFDCMDTNTTKALKKSPECAELSVSYTKLSEQAIKNDDDAKALSLLIKDAAPEKSSKIDKIITAKNSESLDLTNALEIYFDTSKNFRMRFLDKDLNATEQLYKDSRLKRIIKWALFDKNSSNLPRSISKLECKNIEGGDELFFEALLKIRFNSDPTECLIKSIKQSSKESDKDRALFWLYLYTNDTSYLDKAAKGGLNFYSMLAKEATDGELSVNFVDYSQKFTKTSDVNGSDPFFWQELRAKLKNSDSEQLEKIKKKLAFKNTESYYQYVKEKEEGFRKSYFLLPYKDAFSEYNSTQKTLLHAIGRQESLFMAGDVSSAYAIGVMQIIPILGEELAEKRREKIEFFELFEPSKNISYGATHFRWLESKVTHPTLIAVSFNAGYGFFRRIEKDGLFTFKDKELLRYEPFWSIENIPYDETRDYAKKVSLNYAVYSTKFNESVTLTRLLEKLLEIRQK